MVSKGIELVYGGGNVGLMGHIADSVLSRGGKVIGIIPERLVDKEVAHNGLTELIVVKTMHERKAKMAELCDGFIALPGGIGTLEEIMEVFTWTQLGYHSKPCALLNVNGFYDSLNIFIEQMVTTRFLRKEQKELLLISDDAKYLIEQMESSKIVYQDKWLKDKI
ncbi:TIGR00730 family Rossman fold protein [Chitinophaga oryziterrae]